MGGASQRKGRVVVVAVELTWNDVASVHGILILNEAEPVHQLDLCDLSGAMGTKVRLDVGLGDFLQRRGQRGDPKGRGRSRATEEAGRGVTRPRRCGYGRLPLRGRLPRYRRVDETSAMTADGGWLVAACYGCLLCALYPGIRLCREDHGWLDGRMSMRTGSSMRAKWNSKEAARQLYETQRDSLVVGAGKDDEAEDSLRLECA